MGKILNNWIKNKVTMISLIIYYSKHRITVLPNDDYVKSEFTIAILSKIR